ncbi:hypothetical protein BJ742DRAFT_218873 [Cladochytrium replicatum]|nr:hypothetical protein BJ742DRAFT_218873 [Cladochytrium replicatum]
MLTLAKHSGIDRPGPPTKRLRLAHSSKPPSLSYSAIPEPEFRPIEIPARPTSNSKVPVAENTEKTNGLDEKVDGVVELAGGSSATTASVASGSTQADGSGSRGTGGSASGGGATSQGGAGTGDASGNQSTTPSVPRSAVSAAKSKSRFVSSMGIVSNNNFLALILSTTDTTHHSITLDPRISNLNIRLLYASRANMRFEAVGWQNKRKLEPAVAQAAAATAATPKTFDDFTVYVEPGLNVFEFSVARIVESAPPAGGQGTVRTKVTDTQEYCLFAFSQKVV